MIADKIIPCFYILEIEGNAIRSVIDGDYGIEKIAVGSCDFQTDLLATDALQQAILSVIGSSELELGDFEEQVDYNPEFFPSIEPAQINVDAEEEFEENQAIADTMMYELEEKGQIPVVASNRFDRLGDFVEIRWQIVGQYSNIIGKVVANPNQYMMHKSIDQLNRHQSIHREEQKITVQ